MSANPQPATTGHAVTAPPGIPRLLDVTEVAEFLGVSANWVRDHASGRREPRLIGIKLGTAKGKGLWKFQAEDVHTFILEQRGR